MLDVTIRSVKERWNGGMSRQQLKERGFTIIEVVLVLAIAALIFLMIFIALPALQRSQRDTARKNDVSIVSAAVNSYASANRGNLPTTATDDVRRLRAYITNLSGNSDVAHVLVRAYRNTMSVNDGEIIVVLRAQCGAAGANGATQQLRQGTRRQYATITRLESGNSTYCMEA